MTGHLFISPGRDRVTEPGDRVGSLTFSDLTLISTVATIFAPFWSLVKWSWFAPGLCILIAPVPIFPLLLPGILPVPLYVSARTPYTNQVVQKRVHKGCIRHIPGSGLELG
ncbi:hypothetical protein BJV78DRAFT_1176691 [Lactifluus subvellereus]|nr:hypothetical protein BJV78DRAFT_1176691 [Lactifluus subvellereus]